MADLADSYLAAVQVELDSNIAARDAWTPDGPDVRSEEEILTNIETLQQVLTAAQG